MRWVQGKLQAEVQESQDELDDCKREIFQFQRDLEDALVAVQDAKVVICMFACMCAGRDSAFPQSCNIILMSGQGQLSEETRRKDDIRRLESVDSAR